MSGSNEYDWIDDIEDEDNEDARSGRDNNVLRSLRKENKSKDKQIKDLQEQLNALATQTRERSVKDVLTAKGLSDKISKFIPKELTSEDDVMAWVEENGDIFGAVPTSPSKEQAKPDLAALTQISQVQSTGQPFDGDDDQIAALIRSARTPEELNMVLFGSSDGPSAI